MAAISSMRHIFLEFSANLSDFNDFGIKLYILDHTESESRPPEFSKSLFHKIWDKELKNIMLASINFGVDLRQKQNNLYSEDICVRYYF